jgi:hypothetical protein
LSDETLDLDGMLGFLAEEGSHRRDPEEHLAPEILTAYQANELSPEEDERIQGHLAVCRHCTELLLDLDELLQPPETEAIPVADFEAAADWRRLREGSGEAQEPGPPARKDRGDSRMLRSLRAFQLLAAALSVLVVGLLIHTVRLQRGFDILPPLQKTLEFSTTRSAGLPEPPEVIRLPFNLGFVIAGDSPTYRIEILDANEHILKSRETSLREGTIPLGERALSPGSYQVRVYELHDGQVQLVGKPKPLVVTP